MDLRDHSVSSVLTGHHEQSMTPFRQSAVIALDRFGSNSGRSNLKRWQLTLHCHLKPLMRWLLIFNLVFICFCCHHFICLHVSSDFSTMPVQKLHKTSTSFSELSALNSTKLAKTGQPSVFYIFVLRLDKLLQFEIT